MDLFTFYSLFEIASITPLCKRLLEIDHYPTLRLILAFEQAMCRDDRAYGCTKDGKFDENAFSNDVIGFFPEQIERLKVCSEKEEQFWNIFHLIIRKFFHYIATSEEILDRDKLDFFKDQYAAVKVSTFMAAAFGNENFVALIIFVEGVITDLEKKLAQPKHSKGFLTCPPIKDAENPRLIIRIL
jgi:hypothetical protein